SIYWQASTTRHVRLSCVITISLGETTLTTTSGSPSRPEVTVMNEVPKINASKCAVDEETSRSFVWNVKSSSLESQHSNTGRSSKASKPDPDLYKTGLIILSLDD